MKLTEFYPELQGRPGTRVAIDLDSGTSGISYSAVSAIVNQILESAMKKELEELISKAVAQLSELREIKLHLASMSDAEVENNGLEEDD